MQQPEQDRLIERYRGLVDKLPVVSVADLGGGDRAEAVQAEVDRLVEGLQPYLDRLQRLDQVLTYATALQEAQGSADERLSVWARDEHTRVMRGPYQEALAPLQQDHEHDHEHDRLEGSLQRLKMLLRLEREVSGESGVG